ncbi:MAG TPA: TraB/GumN family protein [Candidatus Nanoarchaeia archaeon]|nr:TraB/GumN family protein [Candidatus Nanoarchaeia archaeon]
MTIHLIGTSHIAQQSLREIKTAIEEGQPDLVAVELDSQRAAALLQEHKGKISLADIAKVGFKGYLFAKIGQYIQQKLGKMVGLDPGSDMKTAILLAKKNKKQVVLIDQPIQVTLKKFSKELTWKEKGRFAADIFKGIFFRKQYLKESGLDNLDLRTVPSKELIQKMVGEMKKRYPSVYKTLVADRNEYMVKQLVSLLRKNPDQKILAVVGAGHEEGMKKLLLNVEVVR